LNIIRRLIKIAWVYITAGGQKYRKGSGWHPVYTFSILAILSGYKIAYQPIRGNKRRRVFPRGVD
jgi:hypothetical protein